MLLYAKRNDKHDWDKVVIVGNDRRKFRKMFGVEEEIPEKLLGMTISEFVKKYNHLDASARGYFYGQYFNIDAFADIDDDTIVGDYVEDDMLKQLFEVVKIMLKKMGKPKQNWIEDWE